MIYYIFKVSFGDDFFCCTCTLKFSALLTLPPIVVIELIPYMKLHKFCLVFTRANFTYESFSYNT